MQISKLILHFYTYPLTCSKDSITRCIILFNFLNFVFHASSFLKGYYRSVFLMFWESVLNLLDSFPWERYYWASTACIKLLPQSGLGLVDRTPEVSNIYPSASRKRIWRCHNKGSNPLHNSIPRIAERGNFWMNFVFDLLKI